MAQPRSVVEINLAQAKERLASFESTQKEKEKEKEKEKIATKKSPTWRKLNGEIKKQQTRLKAIEKLEERESSRAAAKSEGK